MATINDINILPSSGLQHIDALIDGGPDWNFVTPYRNTLYYTFSTVGADAAAGGGLLTGACSPFTASQQTATATLMSYIGSITGINFVLTADPNEADFHFANANITASGVSGYCRTSWSYSATGDQTLTSYTAEGWIYIDTIDFVSNTAPTVGNGGHELLLHEIGHALGLKHPFEDSVTLPEAQDNTSNTVMSYTHVGGPYGAYQAYDLAALAFLYGGDGLGGALGVGGAGKYLIGTNAAETLTGGTGNDLLVSGGGNDAVNGGAGTDTAVFAGLRSAYTITTSLATVTISGPQGTDTLNSIEFARFDDQTVTLSSTAINNPPTGNVTITGTAAQGGTLTAQSTLVDADGIGSFSYRWQRSSDDGLTWGSVSGATNRSYLLTQSDVGAKFRVLVDYTDNVGFAESVTSSVSDTVANVNDAPTGQVLISGMLQRGETLVASNTLADVDGMGTVSYRWQTKMGDSWADIAGAVSASFVLGDAQVGKQLRVEARYTDGYGTQETQVSVATNAVTSVNRPVTGSVTINGILKQGQVLSVSNTLADADGLGSFGYQWQQQSGPNWVVLAGATQSSFTLTESEVGQKLRVSISYTDGFGNVENVSSATTTVVANLNDPPMGSVTLSGTVQQGQPLQLSAALTDVDGMGTLSYRWQSSADGNTWTDIAGASATSFTPGSAQLGLMLRGVARYTDGRGTAEAVPSAATIAVPGFQNGSSGADTLTGSAAADTLNGLAGNDKLTGAGGNDVLNGGEGRDTAAYALARAQYTVGAKGLAVTALSGAEGADTLAGVERLQFSDQSLAFDLDGHAGITALTLGAVFGAASVGNAVYAGIGLKLLDDGMSRNDLTQLALEARLGTGFTAAAQVNLLYQNLLGVAPSADELAYWTGLLANGTFTPAALAIMAADLEFNAQNVGLTGLADTGLAYIPG